MSRLAVGHTWICFSLRRVGRGPMFILWNSTSCSRLGNLVLPPSKEKATHPSCGI